MKAFLKTIRVSAVMLCLCSLNTTYAQVKVFTGISYTGVRNNVLEDEEAIYSWYAGGGISLTPQGWNKFSIGLNGMLSRKGYKQYADTWYTFYFHYVSFQPVIEYSPAGLFSLEAGVDVSALVYTNVKSGMATYNHFDCGLIFGFTVFNNKRIAFYSRFIYGLVPMLTYDKIDAMGNFTGEINDLKNTSLLFGIRVNIYHEKVPH